MQLLDLLFPKNCLECKKPGKYICSECLAKVERAKLVCPVCKRYNFGGKTHTQCSQKLALDGMYSYYRYEGVIRKAILALKYRFAHDIAKELAEVCMDGPKFSNCLLIPVPLHTKRQRWRGFNQAGELGKIIAAQMGWEYAENIVNRLEDTTPQVHLGKTERLRNLRGKFAVNENDLSKYRNRTIIIFDDVYTTGATIAEIAKILKKSGAKTVWGMSVARTN